MYFFNEICFHLEVVSSSKGEITRHCSKGNQYVIFLSGEVRGKNKRALQKKSIHERTRSIAHLPAGGKIFCMLCLVHERSRSIAHLAALEKKSVCFAWRFYSKFF